MKIARFFGAEMISYKSESQDLYRFAGKLKNLNKPAVLVLSKSFFLIADYAISRGHSMSSDFIIFHSSLVNSHPSHQKEMHEKPASNHIKSEFLS